MKCEREVTSIKGYFPIGDIDDARVMKNFYEAQIVAEQFHSTKRASMSSAVRLATLTFLPAFTGRSRQETAGLAKSARQITPSA